MIGRTNIGGMKIYAFIVVNYPAGSVCTCSKGSRTMKAKDTSGVYVFPIPSAGSWTVSASSTAHPTPVTKTVSITSYGQSVGVTLAYTKYLLDYADQKTSNTGGWVKSSDTKLWGESNVSAATMNSNGMVFPSATSIMTTNWPIDVSIFTSLCLNITASSSQISVAVMKSLGGDMGYTNANVLAKTNIDGTTSKAILNISAVDESCYIVIGTGSTITATVAQVWLEA